MYPYPNGNPALDLTNPQLYNDEWFQRRGCWTEVSNFLFEHEPCLTDIHQERIGNCTLLSVLQAIVVQNPTLILKMMFSNGKHVYIRLYNNSPIIIQLEKTVFNSRISKHALWVQMIEKAYAIFQWTMKKLNDSTISKYIELLSEGSNAEYNFQLLLGRAPNIYLKVVPEKIYIDYDQLQDFSSYVIYTKNLLALLDGAQDPTDREVRDLYRNIFSVNTPAKMREISQSILTSNLQKKIRHSYYRKGNNQVLRQEKFIELVSSEGGLLAEVKLGLINYARTHFPVKRGLAQYVDNQNYYYDKIHGAIKKNKLVCIGTENEASRGYWRYSHGLASNHSYTVINCYERGVWKFLLLRNPWAEYTRRYSLKEHGRWGVRDQDGTKPPAFGVDISHPAKPMTKEQLTKYLAIEGVFELEASDFTKRFDSLEVYPGE